MHLQQPFNLKAVTTMNVDKRKTQVEVLAPAGSLDIMKAVVAAGGRCHIPGRQYVWSKGICQ